MRRQLRSDPVWLVTNTRTHSGGSIKALTAAEAYERAIRTGWLGREPGDAVEVRSFAGQDRISRTVFDGDGRVVEEFTR